MTTKRAYFQSRTRAVGGFGAMLIGLSALAIGFTGSAGATYETNPTSNVVGAECSVVAAGVSTTAFNTSGDGKKSDGKLQVAVSGAPNAVVIEVLDPAGAQIHGVAVQHVDPAIQSQGYYFGVPVTKGAKTTALTADGGGQVASYTICYSIKSGGGAYGGGGGSTTTTTDPSTTTTTPSTTTTVPSTTTTVPSTTTTVPSTTTTTPSTTTTVPTTTTWFNTTTTVPSTTTTSVSSTTITVPSTTTTEQVLGTTVTSTPETTVTTAPTKVAGTQVTRTLPRTGADALPLTEAGIVLVLIGLALMASGRMQEQAQG